MTVNPAPPHRLKERTGMFTTEEYVIQTRQLSKVYQAANALENLHPYPG
jgi:hypothetical protein